MKGSILSCLEELVVTRFGRDKWEQSLEDAGLKKSTVFLPITDYDDSKTMQVVEAVCKNLQISLEQAADAFGDHWVNAYSQELYDHFYADRTAKDFLLNMDNVHVAITKNMKNARPPRFEYEWKDEKTLIMHYKSHRPLVDFVVGLVKGVGKYYKEDLGVTKIGSNKVQIVFQ